MASAYTYAQLKTLAQTAGLDEAHASVAALIALAESGGNPSTRNVNSNGTVDVGLWQINTVNWPALGVTAADLNNPATNAWAMAQLSNKGANFQPWAASEYQASGGGWMQRNTATGTPNPAVKKPTSQPWYGSWSNPLGGLLDQSRSGGLNILGDIKKGVSLGLLSPGTYGLGVGSAAATGAEAAAGAGAGAGAGAAAAGGAAAKLAAGAGALVAWEWLSDPQHLLRVVYVAGGVVLAVVGAAKVINVTPPLSRIG
jgi:hypothetical protein